MSRSYLAAVLATCLCAVGCNAIAAIAGAPKIVSVEVTAPAGIFVGETAQATSNAVGDDGQTHNGRPVKWRSSDPAALSIDAQGKMLGIIAGRSATITAEVDGKTGSATVAVAGEDTRFGYAVGDQPTVAGPYSPGAGNSCTTGGAIQITRASEGMYSVRFAGLGRLPGDRDNVQVSANNPTTPVYCKPGFWDASGADLVVIV